MSITLSDLFSTNEAIEYVNNALKSTGITVSQGMFKKLVWVKKELNPFEFDKPVGGEERGAKGAIFFRSQLDEFVGRIVALKHAHRRLTPINPRLEDTVQIVRVSEVREKCGLSQQSFSYFMSKNKEKFPYKKIGNLLVMLRSAADEIYQIHGVASQEMSEVQNV